MTTGIEQWVNQTDRDPGNYYELMGARLFDPDHDELLAQIRAASRVLLTYQNHQDPKIVQRAMRLQMELGHALGVFEHPEQLRKYQEEMLGRLSADLAACADLEEAGEPTLVYDWLKNEKNVHPDWLDRIELALSNRRLDGCLQALDDELTSRKAAVEEAKLKQAGVDTVDEERAEKPTVEKTRARPLAPKRPSPSPAPQRSLPALPAPIQGKPLGELIRGSPFGTAGQSHSGGPDLLKQAIIIAIVVPVLLVGGLVLYWLINRQDVELVVENSALGSGDPAAPARLPRPRPQPKPQTQQPFLPAAPVEFKGTLSQVVGHKTFQPSVQILIKADPAIPGSHGVEVIVRDPSFLREIADLWFGSENQGQGDLVKVVGIPLSLRSLSNRLSPDRDAPILELTRLELINDETAANKATEKNVVAIVGQSRSDVALADESLALLTDLRTVGKDVAFDATYVSSQSSGPDILINVNVEGRQFRVLVEDKLESPVRLNAVQPNEELAIHADVHWFGNGPGMQEFPGINNWPAPPPNPVLIARSIKGPNGILLAGTTTPPPTGGSMSRPFPSPRTTPSPLPATADMRDDQLRWNAIKQDPLAHAGERLKLEGHCLSAYTTRSEPFCYIRFADLAADRFYFSGTEEAIRFFPNLPPDAHVDFEIEVAGGSRSSPRAQLVWIARHGQPETKIAFPFQPTRLTAQPQSEIAVGSGGVTALSYSHDGQWLAASASDEMCKVYARDAQTATYVLPEHDSNVRTLEWSPDGRFLATYDGQKSRVFELNENHAELEESLSVTVGTSVSGDIQVIGWLPDSTRVILVASIETTGPYQFTLQRKSNRWKALPLVSPRSGISSARAIAVSPNGRLLAHNGRGRVSGYGVFLHKYNERFRRFGDITMISSPREVNSLYWRADMLGARTRDVFLIWDSSRDEMHPIKSIPLQTSSDHVAWNADGGLLAVGHSDVVVIHNIESGEMQTLQFPGDLYLRGLLWSADGKRLAVLNSDYEDGYYRTYIWNINPDVPVHQLLLKTYPAAGAWDPKDARLATGDSNGHVMIWQVD